jgi:hypothetical protein
VDFRLSHHPNCFRVGNSGRAFGKIKFEVERKVRRLAARKCKRTYVPRLELVEGDASRSAPCLRFPLSSRADTLGSRHGSRITLAGTPVVAAPGKIFLVGEYAVLDGGMAVLAAVSRYAVAQYVTGIEPWSAMVDEAVKRSLAAIGESSAALPPGSVMVDTDAFCQGKFKMGLGSGAATAAATVGAMFETAGWSGSGTYGTTDRECRHGADPLHSFTWWQ